jgi:hypothetical protein
MQNFKTNALGTFRVPTLSSSREWVIGINSCVNLVNVGIIFH